MIINSQQLINNIKKPNNLYLLFGFEELLIQQSNDEILKNLKEQNYENRFIFDIDARSNFDNLKNELTSHNLFITKKIIQINIASTNAKITKELKKNNSRYKRKCSYYSFNEKTHLSAAKIKMV